MLNTSVKCSLATYFICFLWKYLTTRYLLLVTAALLNLFMVMFGHWQHLVKVGERSWSWFSTEKSQKCTSTIHPDLLLTTSVQCINVALYSIALDRFKDREHTTNSLFSLVSTASFCIFCRCSKYGVLIVQITISNLRVNLRKGINQMWGF